MKRFILATIHSGFYSHESYYEDVISKVFKFCEDIDDLLNIWSLDQGYGGISTEYSNDYEVYQKFYKKIQELGDFGYDFLLYLILENDIDYNGDLFRACLNERFQDILIKALSCREKAGPPLMLLLTVSRCKRQQLPLL